MSCSSVYYLSSHSFEGDYSIIFHQGRGNSTKSEAFSARLGSLYSDFRLQQTINPDGYAANVDAWEKGLSLALKSGAIPGWKDVLSLRAGTGLLQVLESKEWGKPQALRAVFVGHLYSATDKAGATLQVDLE